jgi:hypothetical protein
MIKFKNDTPELIKEIEYLELVYKHISMNLNLFYNYKIHNYQIVKNINNVLNIITPGEVDDLDKIRLLNKYNGILSGINKMAKDLEIKETNLGENEYNCFEPLIGENPFNNKKNYFLQLKRGIDNNEINIYDKDGYNVNKIHLFYDIFNSKNYLSLMFSEKILIIFLRELYFYIISDDYKMCESIKFYFDHLLPFNHFLSGVNYSFDDLLKINSTNILLINSKNGYVITFDKELKNLIQLYKLSTVNIIKANSVYYMNKNNIVETGIIIISENSLNNKDLDNINKDSKFTMFNDKMEIIHEFNFKLNYKKNQIIKIHYAYKNNMILIFTMNKILQLKLDTQEIITIYDITGYFNAEETNYQNLANKIKIIYNYDKANKKIEEKILIINEKKKQFCLFEWEEKILILKKKIIYPNLLNIIVYYPSDILYLLNAEPIFEPEILFINSVVKDSDTNNSNNYR